MEELLKAKEEEMAKYVKIKEVLSEQLNKVKAELHALKELNTQNTTKLEAKDEKIAKLVSQFNAQGGENTQLHTQLQAKDAELAEMTKDQSVKETLALEAKKAKVEAMEMKERMLKAEEKAANATKSCYPDLEKQIKQLEEQNNALKTENEQLKKNFASIDEFNKILQQLKTGLLNVGEQNALSHKKLDSLTEIVGKIGSTASTKTEEIPSSSPQNTPSQAVTLQEDPTIHRRKPSEIMSATKDAQKPPEETLKSESPDQGRRPSDMGKEKTIKEQAPSNKLVKKELTRPELESKEPVTDATEEKSKPSTTPEPRSVKTVPYPSDGVILCPKCGAKTFQEMENRAKIITFTPVKKYGKKYYCKKCHEEWDYQY